MSVLTLPVSDWWRAITSLASTATALIRDKATGSLVSDCCCPGGAVKYFVFVQDYTFTLASGGPATVWLTRYCDPDLTLSMPTTDLGGRIPANAFTQTPEMLFTVLGRGSPPDESRTGLPDERVLFMAITGESASTQTTNRYEAAAHPIPRDDAVTGTTLDDTVAGAGGAGGSDWNSENEYDMAMAMRNTETLVAGVPTLYTTRTILGMGDVAPDEIVCPPGGQFTACPESIDSCGPRTGSDDQLATGNVDIDPDNTGECGVSTNGHGAFGWRDEALGRAPAPNNQPLQFRMRSPAYTLDQRVFASAVAIGGAGGSTYLTSGLVGPHAGGLTAPALTVDPSKKTSSSSFSVFGSVGVTLTQSLMCVI